MTLSLQLSPMQVSHSVQKKTLFMSAGSVFRTEIDILISAWLLGMVIRNQYSLFDRGLGYHWYLLFEREYLCLI